MKKSFLVNIIVFICSLFLVAGISSCKKKTGDMGPEGPQGPQGNSEYFNTKSDGYIQGTITGINKNGVAFTETYSYSIYKNSLTESYVDSVNASTYNIGISRYPVSHFGDGATFNFSASSMMPLTITSSSFNFEFTKPLGDNKYFVFSSNSSAIATLSGLNYDNNTGIITGNYVINLTGGQNSTGNPANITGSFKATLKSVWY